MGKVLFWMFGVIIGLGLIAFNAYLFWALKTLCDDLGNDTDPWWWYCDAEKVMEHLKKTLEDVK